MPEMQILGWDPMRTMKRHQLQILRWGKRIACSSSSAASYMRMNKRGAPLECCQGGGSSLFKQFVWKVRSRWRQYYLKRKREISTVQFSYDAKSYHQNFDSGRPLDRPSPFAP